MATLEETLGALYGLPVAPPSLNLAPPPTTVLDGLSGSVATPPAPVPAPAPPVAPPLPAAAGVQAAPTSSATGAPHSGRSPFEGLGAVGIGADFASSPTTAPTTPPTTAPTSPSTTGASTAGTSGTQRSLDDLRRAIAGIESSDRPQTWNWVTLPDGRRVRSRYRGLFQFGPDQERRYGITDWTDRSQQERAFGQHVGWLSGQMERRLGRPATDGELYLAHQQGIAGAPALLNAEAGTPAWRAIRRFYRSDAMAQRAVLGNIPRGHRLSRLPVDEISAADFAGMWTDRLDRGGGGGGARRASPTSSTASTAGAGSASPSASSTPSPSLGGAGARDLQEALQQALGGGPQSPGVGGSGQAAVQPAGRGRSLQAPPALRNLLAFARQHPTLASMVGGGEQTLRADSQARASLRNILRRMISGNEAAAREHGLTDIARWLEHLDASAPQGRSGAAV